MNLSHSSAVYGKVGISDVRVSDAACHSLSLMFKYLNLPARAFKRMTVSSFKAVAAYCDAVAGNISTWAQ
jgi:hypothetical protein